MDRTTASTASHDPLVHVREHGSGPPLLLVHGVMISGEMFEPVIERLARRFRVIVPDLRGHGHSRGLPPPYDATVMASDLVQLLDALGLPPVAVLGYSQGGAIAQQFVLDHPSRCSRLVLACTYAFNMATLREQIEGRVVPTLIRLLGMRRFARRVLALGLKKLDPDRARWVVELIAAQDGRAMVGAWRAAMAFDSRTRLGEIRCPTLVIAAANDDAVPMHHAQFLSDGIRGSRLVVVDGADHALIWTHPGRLADEVARFVGPEVDGDSSTPPLHEIGSAF